VSDVTDGSNLVIVGSDVECHWPHGSDVTVGRNMAIVGSGDEAIGHMGRM